MKLLRLTSDRAIIENNFNQSIEIPKDAQIAVQSASFSIDENIFSINGKNNEITFNYSKNNSQLIKLTDATYSKTNSNDLLVDFTNSLNNQMEFNSTNLGTQWQISQKGGKTQVSQQLCPANIQLSQNYFGKDDTLSRKDASINILSGNRFSINANNAVVNDTQLIASYASMCKGVSSFRIRIDKLNTNANTNENGFFIGLSEIQPKNWSIGTNNLYSSDEKTYFLHVQDCAAGNILLKKKGGNASDTGSALQETGNNADPNANQIEINKSGDKLFFSLYRQADGNSITLGSATLTNPQVDLYPFIIMRGDSSNLELGRIRILFDPFKNNFTPYLSPLQADDGHDDSFGATPIRINNQVNTRDKSLKFQDPLVAELLGFESDLITNNAQVYRGQFIHISENLYKFQIENPFFLIRTVNIDLESFDNIQGGKFNILQCIGNKTDNASNSVYYETSSPVFLDVKNNVPRNLSSIRVELLNADLSRPTLDGLFSLVLLIK